MFGYIVGSATLEESHLQITVREKNTEGEIKNGQSRETGNMW